MFEIGSSLRDARLRRGLALDDAADATLIRGRYLEALEQERFELLPEGLYRRSFLRAYAEYLGLDGEVMLREYDLLLDAAEPAPVAAPRRLRLEQLARPREAAAIAAAILVAAVALAAWQLGSGGGTQLRPTAAGARHPRVVHRRARRRPPTRTPVVPKPPHPAAVLSLRAVGGRCWILVRVGSANGRVVLTRTLDPGAGVRLGLHRPLWIRFGAPQNLAARLDDRAVRLPLAAGPGDLSASATGLRRAA
jgi:hypothetical protein